MLEATARRLGRVRLRVRCSGGGKHDSWLRMHAEMAAATSGTSLSSFGDGSSGLRGGGMFADGLIAYLQENELMDKVPLIAQPFNPEESLLDEAIGYSLAALGFGFQIFNGFALPFPLNLVFLPLTIVEWFLRIQISMESTKL